MSQHLRQLSKALMSHPERVQRNIHLSDAVPVSVLSALRERVVDIDSDTEASSYLFACGCRVNRPVGAGECTIVWCADHRWED